ncbi:T9SS type A sorting domain-containing protein [Flavobacterium sp. MR2016-29]|uniref:T9SS type A sorting domain-containing protein n=1 Tax=Flavobacterium sp. MR2016-29 TaxID=2783795 RepID=UPI00188CAC90|nr:T9SS type A sorting domain-containing protein [Flavobacterium sp. MR2016-29]MBF4491384.1 T9SS type A sorting domain-containing protein [Flavobacterium sp. MR2016-29]
MKNNLYLLIFLMSLSSLSAQNYYLSAPEGFGSNTTGGGTATPVSVSTLADLTAKLKLTTPQVILVSGTINFTYTSLLVSDKTIIGLPGAKLVNNDQTAAGSGILNLKAGSNNIIIRNLIFEGPGAYDVDGHDNLTSEATNLWVDHCEFQDGMDGNFDNKGTADNVTISWCKFTYLKAPKAGGSGGADDHRFTDLVGSSKTDYPADGHYSITFKNCYWAEGCKERMPRARNAELHILNCYYNTSVSGSLAIGLGGGDKNSTCYVEGTDFAKIGTAFKNYISTDGGVAGATFVNSLKAPADYGDAVAKPSYAYTTIPVADVAGYITNTSCGAGATLQAAADGKISSSCTNLGLTDKSSLDLDLKYYPTVIDSLLNIQFSNHENGTAIISIFSANGSKVYTNSKNISSDEKLELNVGNLAKGTYICKIQIENRIKTFKVVKN